MARPQKEFPTPGKRCRGKSWKIFWRRGGSVYEVSVGRVSEGAAERPSTNLLVSQCEEPDS